MLTAIANFRGYFSTPAVLQIVDFAVQFCFRSKFSFHEKPYESSLTVAWFSWTNHNSLLRIATNEIALFCIDKRLRQMTFSCLLKWATATFRVTMEDFEIKKRRTVVIFSLLYTTNRSHVAVYLFSNRSQRTSKFSKNTADALGYRLVCHFFVLIIIWRHPWSITEQTHGNMESIC